MRENVSGSEELHEHGDCVLERRGLTNPALLHAPGQEQHTCMVLYCFADSSCICYYNIIM